MSTLHQPQWDLSQEYESFEDARFIQDKEEVESKIQQLKELAVPLVKALNNLDEALIKNSKSLLKTCWEMAELEESTFILLRNLHVFTNCLLSVDGSLSEAKLVSSELAKISSLYHQAIKPLKLVQLRSPEEFFESYLDNPKTASYRFLLEHARKDKDLLLSLEEENLIAALSTDGHHQWGKLYSTLTSSLKFEIDHPSEGTQKIGLAQAAGYLKGDDSILRERAFHARNEALVEHQETFAAILNSLAGWRHELYQKRSHSRQVDFLDSPLKLNRIEAETLEALIETTREFKPLGQRALTLQAKAQGIEKLNPWDQLAPCPSHGEVSKKFSFDEGMKLIREAFERVHPEMAEFADLMQENNWIEASVGENKSPGAYCTRFSKSQTPRVYMTYMGSTADVITLAHEIGHAFHGWKMRDMPRGEQNYCMTLAETASIFAETVVRDALLEKATSREEKLQILYQELVSAGSMLINIPTRFEFEKRFYEQRKKRTLTPDHLKELMSEVWSDWYGESMTQTDPMFWASKLHFSMSALSFYNFPYLFGYLFSQGIYAQREQKGEQFYDFYIDVLKDTGRMTAEDLVQKHLGMDLREPDFWRQSLSIIEKQIERFDVLLDG